jgi:hypothetical protein
MPGVSLLFSLRPRSLRPRRPHCARATRSLVLTPSHFSRGIVLIPSTALYVAGSAYCTSGCHAAQRMCAHRHPSVGFIAESTSKSYTTFFLRASASTAVMSAGHSMHRGSRLTSSSWTLAHSSHSQSALAGVP